jgi:P27 family predicted phage terminase small subunit
MPKTPAPPPKPPPNLSRRARAFWNQTFTEYHFETAAQLRLLEELCRCMTQLETIQKTIRSDGLTVKGSRNQPVAHPLLSAESDCRKQILAFSRALELHGAEE